MLITKISCNAENSRFAHGRNDEQRGRSKYFMRTERHPLVLSLVLVCVGLSALADEPPIQKRARKSIELPGIVIDLERRFIDLEATVCLDKGFLELVACTKGSKEHESIIAVSARPMHIHTALLLLGANNGNPAMRKQVGEQENRWVNIPPRGDLIEAFLVFKNSDEKMIEHPVSDFIARSTDRSDEIGVVENHGKTGKSPKDSKFPSTFLFAGSHLQDNGKGPRKYLADLSGHVISIATFGDELLCLPGVQSHSNGMLTWRVNPQTLPKVGAKITLRLRIKKDQETGVKE